MSKQILNSILLAAVCTIGVIRYQQHENNTIGEEELSPIQNHEDKEHRRLVALYPFKDPKVKVKKDEFSYNPLVNKYRIETTNDGAGDSSRKMKAVVHIGPPKTGTTSIQNSIREREEELTADNFSMIWKELDRDTVNEFGFVSCFPSNVWLSIPNKENFCPESEMAAIQKLGREGKNIFLSSEFFSFITDVAPLANFLKPWDTTIVYYHRWYHDWLLSNFNQSLKSRFSKQLENFDQFIDSRGNGEVYVYSYEDYFDHLNENDFLGPRESYKSFYRYRQYFDNVVVLDYEDENIGVTENMFCHGMGGEASRTCEAEKKNVVPKVSNPTVPMTYLNMAYGANQLGKATYCSREHFDEVVKKIKYHQESTLGRASSDVPMTCVKRELLQKLLDVSFKHRNEMLPNTPFTDEEEGRVTQEYWEKMKVKACEADIVAIMDKPEWIKFFENLERETSCPLSVK
eukprot:CAMPEP_0183760358 /NCGR_PEP_ID=MMETSP0739-20130205/7721_1 /TAXON_ID=385413 /ORGANISM="Thalassiosira miniscula, Strain CCMP1093" /LENGTH=458 /DNA_ID=CAMNT_0025998331 /DNA_START=62 /DNA_END=1438 /DNA_ORIENTATION=+